MRSVNSDGLTPLDVAFLSNNRELVRLLLANGATEGNESNSELEKKIIHPISSAAFFSRDEYEKFGNALNEFTRGSRKTRFGAQTLRQSRQFANQVAGTVGETEKRLEKDAYRF